MAEHEFNDASYAKLIQSMKLKPLSYHDVANDWSKNTTEWYHAMIAIQDIPIVLAIPNFKIYAWCRCKVVADDGSEDHFHWHGLVHFTKCKKESWRKKAQRAGIKFSSHKNTFKRIICLDHAVGVLRYISCGDGQRVGRRDNDGLVTHPHTHYSRQPIDPRHLHARGKPCAEVRDEISKEISKRIDLSSKPNWTKEALHDDENCLCDRGKLGKERKAVANYKRKEYYKTEAGIAMKKMYKERAAIKRQLLNHLTMMNVSKKAKLCNETIDKLVKLL